MVKTEFVKNKLDASFTLNLVEVLRPLKPMAPSQPTSNITQAIPSSVATAKIAARQSCYA